MKTAELKVLPVAPVRWVDIDGEIIGQPAVILGFVKGVTEPSELSGKGVSGIGSLPNYDGKGSPSVGAVDPHEAGGAEVITGFGMNGTGYYCVGPRGELGGNSIDISSGGYESSHFQGEISRQEGKGLVFALCATLIEAAYPHVPPP